MDSFYFGSEADDRTVAAAFNDRVHPLGAKINAIWSSDIGHWDVPDLTEPLAESWDLVEQGVISEQDFKALVFGNPYRLYTEANPDFFRGTEIERKLAARPPPPTPRPAPPDATPCMSPAMKPLQFLRRSLAALALLAAAAAPAGPARAADIIRIGVATAGGGDPITWGGSPGGVVRANNWLEQAFAADGVKVEWLFFKGAGPAVNEALSNKQIDFAYQGDLPQVVGRANGLKTKLLVASGVRNNLYLVAPVASPLSSIKDIRDHKVSIFRGTNGHLVAINVLAAHGLSERDIKGVNLDAGSAQAALVSNGVDAAFGGYEWFKVRDQGLAKVIYSTQGQDPAYTRQASLLVREEFERDNPAQVQKVVDGARLALGLGRGQSRRAVQALGKERRALRVLGRRVRQAGPGRAQLAADRRLHHRPLQGGGGRRAQAQADPPRSIGGRLVRRPLPEAGAQDAGPGTLLDPPRRRRQGRRGRAPGLGALIGDAHGRPVLFRRLARRAAAALGAPGRLDRRALAAARAAASAMARGRQPGLDLAAGAAAGLGNAARPGRQWRPVAQHRRQPAARAGRLRRRRPAGLLGVAMGLSRRLEAYLLPTFNALVQIPVLAWLPFVLLLVGIGEALKIILIAKAALVPVTLNTLQGFRQASPALREVGRVYGTRVVRKCWRSCCRWPRPRCSPACGWASPRPGCRWWWWSWWPPAKAWAT